MLMGTLWGTFSSLMGLFYAGMQVIVPSLPPAPLSSSVIATDKYMGNWYLVAAASWDEDGLNALNTVDSNVLNIQKGSNSTFTVTETPRVEDTCRKTTQTYQLMDPFLFREDFDTIMLIWDGKLVNCTSCIIMLYVDEEEETRTMLLARDEKTPDEVIQDFKTKMESVYMEDFFQAPLKNGYCKADAA